MQVIESSSPYLKSIGLSSEPEGITMALQVFFDESGRLQDGSYVAFGGCVASEASWKAIERNWNQLLSPHGMYNFSLKDALEFRGNFLEWRNRCQERDDLICSLARIAFENVDFFTYFCMSYEEFQALSEDEKEKYDNPVYYGFTGCMRQVLERSQRTEPIQICCDNSEKYSEKCLQLYHQLRFGYPEFKLRCGHIAFGEDQWFTGLQLADLYVYCVRHREWNKGSLDPLVVRVLAILEPNGYVEDVYERDFGAGLVSGNLKKSERIIKQ